MVIHLNGLPGCTEFLTKIGMRHGEGIYWAITQRLRKLLMQCVHLYTKVHESQKRNSRFFFPKGLWQIWRAQFDMMPPEASLSRCKINTIQDQQNKRISDACQSFVIFDQTCCTRVIICFCLRKKKKKKIRWSFFLEGKWEAQDSFVGASVRIVDVCSGPRLYWWRCVSWFRHRCEEMFEVKSTRWHKFLQ